MLDFTALSTGNVIPDIADYIARTDRCVALLAEACGASPAIELQRFRSFRSKLAGVARPVSAPAPGDWAGAIDAITGHGPPVVFELVLTYGAGGPQGFGYLTQGANAGTVPESLRELTRATLEVFLDGGGDRAGAELLVDLIARAFPEVERLGGYRGAAQAMIVGLAPRAEGVGLKAYFNTRMYIDGAHRERVRSILDRTGVAAGAGWKRAYDALYDASFGARFAGVGADIDGECRAKLYVRTDTERAFAHAEAAGAAIGVDVRAEELRALYPEEQLAGEVEIAVALRAGGAPTLKWTPFFPGKVMSLPALRRTEEILREHGHDPTTFVDCMRTLARHGDVAQRAFPLHGVGFELPAGAPAKVNLYMQPAR